MVKRFIIMSLEYSRAGARIGLQCGGPKGALIGCFIGFAVAVVLLLIQDDTVNQVGEAA
jgi:hypothetical protein